MMNSLGLGCSPIHNRYWLGIVDHTASLAVVAPIESVITCHVCPSSHVSLIPSAVATYVVSPRGRYQADVGRRADVAGDHGFDRCDDGQGRCVVDDSQPVPIVDRGTPQSERVHHWLSERDRNLV